MFLIGKWPNNILSASFKEDFYVIKCDQPHSNAQIRFIFLDIDKGFLPCYYYFLP